MWAASPYGAGSAQKRIERVLDWATASGYRSGDNPARWRNHLDQLLAHGPPAEHYAALPYVKIAEFLAWLLRGEGSKRLLAFQLLTAVRPSEAREAVWGEFDLAAATWVIPAARMKKGLEHRVPLSAAALSVLRLAGGGGGAGEYYSVGRLPAGRFPRVA